MAAALSHVVASYSLPREGTAEFAYADGTSSALAQRALEETERDVRIDKALQRYTELVCMLTRSRARGGSVVQASGGVRARPVGSRSLSEAGSVGGAGNLSSVGAGTENLSAVVATAEGSSGASAIGGGFRAGLLTRSGQVSKFEVSSSVGAEAKDGQRVEAAVSRVPESAVVIATGMESGGVGASVVASAAGIGATAAGVPGLGGSARVPSGVSPAMATRTAGEAAPTHPLLPSSSGDSSSHSEHYPPSAAGNIHISSQERTNLLMGQFSELVDLMKQRESERKRRSGTELPANISRFSGQRCEWKEYKMQIFAYLDVKNFPKEFVEAAMETYRSNGPEYSDPNLSPHLKKAFAASLRGNPAAHVQAIHDGIGKLVALADIYDLQTMARLHRLMARLWGGISYKGNVDDFFREFREVNGYPRSFGVEFPEKVVVVCIMYSLPPEFASSKHTIAAREGITMEEAHYYVSSVAKSLEQQRQAGRALTNQRSSATVGAPALTGALRNSHGRCRSNRSTVTNASGQQRDQQRREPRQPQSQLQRLQDSLPPRSQLQRIQPQRINSSSGGNEVKGPTCFRCGERGHFARKCRKVSSTYCCSNCGGNHLPTICSNTNNSQPSLRNRSSSNGISGRAGHCASSRLRKRRRSPSRSSTSPSVRFGVKDPSSR